MDLARSSSVHLPVVGGAAALAAATGAGTTDDQIANLSDVVGGRGQPPTAQRSRSPGPGRATALPVCSVA